MRFPTWTILAARFASAAPVDDGGTSTASPVTATFDDIGNAATNLAGLEDVGVYKGLDWVGFGRNCTA
jgi:hypothetical protein